MIKPYYQDDAVTIYHGDCREIIPTLGRLDLLLTDPPYGVNGGSGTVGRSRSNKSSYASYEDTLDNLRTTIIPAFVAALEACGGRGIVTPGPKAMHLYPPCIAFGSLWHSGTCALNMWGRASSQPVFYYGRPPRLGKHIADTTFQITSTESDGACEHPCPKPIGVWKKLMYVGSEDGDTVLDPFAGSGTTGRAAKDLHRKAILIEIDERYCEIAANRMAQEVLPLGT